MESPEVPVMETMPKPATDGVQLALSIALFAAFSVNLVLLGCESIFRLVEPGSREENALNQ